MGNIKDWRGGVALRLVVFLLMFLLIPVVGKSQTLDQVNKEISDRLLKSFTQFYSAYFLVVEMKLDPDCGNFKDIPNISTEDWIRAIQTQIPGSKKDIDKLRKEHQKAIEGMRNAKAPDGRRASLVAVYLPFKEALIKGTTALEPSSKADVCGLITQGISNIYEKSLDHMKFLKELEEKRIKLGGK